MFKCSSVQVLGVHWREKLHLRSVPLDTACTLSNNYPPDFISSNSSSVNNLVTSKIPCDTLQRKVHTNVSLVVQDSLCRCATTNSSVKFGRKFYQSFSPGDAVYVRNYRDGRIQWIPGVVIHRFGNMLYKVKVGDFIWSRFGNHMRHRYQKFTMHPSHYISTSDSTTKTYACDPAH